MIEQKIDKDGFFVATQEEATPKEDREIGRASCRERVCLYV